MAYCHFQTSLNSAATDTLVQLLSGCGLSFPRCLQAEGLCAPSILVGHIYFLHNLQDIYNLGGSPWLPRWNEVFVLCDFGLHFPAGRWYWVLLPVLAVCLSSRHDVLGSVPVLHCVTGKAGGAEAQDHPWLRSKFQADPGYKSSVKESRKSGREDESWLCYTSMKLSAGITSTDTKLAWWHTYVIPVEGWDTETGRV